MSQWNALSVSVIKTRKIECKKLNLPPILVSKQSSVIPTACSSSTSTKSNSNSFNKDPHLSVQESGSSFSSTECICNSMVCSEDEVFRDSFDTPPEKDGCFTRNKTKRCHSLPTYLRSEQKQENGVKCTSKFRPRRLFEEALNLEPFSRSEQNYLGHSYPRYQERILSKQATRTPHAERMKSTKSPSLIAYDRNNNNSFNDHFAKSEVGLHSSTLPNNKFDARSWEQRVLVLTSKYEFGTEAGKTPKDDSRPKSVALSANISKIVNDKVSKASNLEDERQVKSETTTEMPKLQTAVWDYIKRRSTKRKRKNSRSQKNGNPTKDQSKQSSSKNDEKNGEASCKEKVQNTLKKFDKNSGAKCIANHESIPHGLTKVKFLKYRLC